MRKLTDFKIGHLDISNTDTVYVPPKRALPTIEQHWQKAEKHSAASGRPLWNGLIYRLNKVDQAQKNLRLDFSLTDYRCYLAAPYVKDYMKALPFSKRINGLYVAAHVITADGKYLLGVTSSNSLFPHTHDLISGSLNKDEALVNSSKDLVKFLESELFEESGIEKDHIKTTEGICLLQTTSTRIGFFFLVRLKISSKQLQKILRLNFEHQKLLLLTKKELINFAQTEDVHFNPTITRILSEAKKQSQIE